MPYRERHELTSKRRALRLQQEIDQSPVAEWTDVRVLRGGWEGGIQQTQIKTMAVLKINRKTTSCFR